MLQGPVELAAILGMWPQNTVPRQLNHGLGIKVSAAKDGSFTVTNARNNFSKTYKAR